MKENKKKKSKKLNKFLSLFDYKYWFYDFTKLTGAIPTLIYLRLKYKFINKKNERKYHGPVLIVANHVTFIDPVIIASTFWDHRVSFLATSDLYKNWFLKFLFKGFTCIRVDRGAPSLKIIKDAINVLNRGHSVCIFPEGHINFENKNLSFKSGASMIACQAGVSIKQIHIEKRKHWYNRQKVYFGDTINPLDYVKGPIPTIQEIDKISQLLHEQEEKLALFAKNNE